MREQVSAVIAALENITAGYRQGYHLVGHSQGALATRTVLEEMSHHNVQNYLSLSGPHMGQFGVIGGMERFFPNITTDEAYEVLYTDVAQDIFSAANYWHDPFHEKEFLEYVQFLDKYNNQTGYFQSERLKKNFLSTNKVILCGSPGDGTIQPWQSAFFGFWEAGDNHTIIPMHYQPIYQNDYIGLQTLYNDNRLFFQQPQGVRHTDWLFQEDVFVKFILPWLH